MTFIEWFWIGVLLLFLFFVIWLAAYDPPDDIPSPSELDDWAREDMKKDGYSEKEIDEILNLDN